MTDHAWVKIESVPAYYRDDNPLGDAADYRAFITQALEHLHADAWRCYRKHGRGVIVLGRPSGVFVEGWYGLPRPGQRLALQPACWEALVRYDPGRELLVGISDGTERPAQFWRLAAEPVTSEDTWTHFDLTRP